MTDPAALKAMLSAHYDADWLARQSPAFLEVLYLGLTAAAHGKASSELDEVIFAKVEAIVGAKAALSAEVSDDEAGWWADFWITAGEKKRALLRDIQARAEQLFAKARTEAKANLELGDIAMARYRRHMADRSIALGYGNRQRADEYLGRAVEALSNAERRYAAATAAHVAGAIDPRAELKAMGYLEGDA